jgi:hypothetical protein
MTVGLSGKGGRGEAKLFDLAFPWLPHERSIRGCLELHADGVVVGVGVGPFGVGGELEFHAFGDGRFDQVGPLKNAILTSTYGVGGVVGVGMP